MAELNLLQEKILSDGVIRPGNVLKVDSFLNHQIDVPFISELGKEFKKLFGDRKVDKILTIEASGIGIACLTAVYFGVPVVFAKKSAGSNMDKEMFATEVMSYTHNRKNHVVVSKKYLKPGTKEGIRGVIRSSVFLGLTTHYFITTDGGQELEILQTQEGHDILPDGSAVTLTVKAGRINVFRRATEETLIREEGL